MREQRFEVTIILHTDNTKKFIYNDTRENIEDIVSKIWYEGFLDTNPNNPKRKIHILPDQIRHIQITEIEQ